jgi:hypothetical protein
MFTTAIRKHKQKSAPTSHVNWKTGGVAIYAGALCVLAQVNQGDIMDLGMVMQ